MNESESSMKCRENEHPVKTAVCLLRRMSLADALQDGGLSRSSDEAPIMGVERRG
jgi:hypothetical protein